MKQQYIGDVIDGDYGLAVIALPLEDDTTIEEQVYLSDAENAQEAKKILRKKLGIKKFSRTTLLFDNLK